MNSEFAYVQTGFRKGRGTRDQIANIIGSSKKQESSRKTSISALLTMPKPFTVWITTNCGKFLKRREYQITWPASWEICMQIKKQPLELDMEQQTDSRLEKEYIKAVYCYPAYLPLCRVQLLSCVRLFATPWTVAYQAPPSMVFSRQEYWSGLPFLSPMHKSEKWKWSRSAVSDSSWPHGLQPTRLPHPWDFPGKNTGVGCHHLLRSLEQAA